jgi:uncharacterized membrane protein
VTGAKKVASIVFGVALIAYPVAAYFAFTYLEPRLAAAALLVAFLPAAIYRLRSEVRRALAPFAAIPVLTAGLLAGSAALGSTTLALLVPVFINAALLFAFGSTLLWGPPLIERFARMQVEDLSEPELRWCRAWTIVWSVFFVFNGSTAGVLATLPTMDAWTTYNGLISYILMGHLFGIEYTVRKYRFGRLGDHVLDRALRRIFAAIRPAKD